MIAIDIHPTQYPTAIVKQLELALAHGKLPARFLYDSPAQAARWLRYHEAFAPPQKDPQFEELYKSIYRSTLASSFNTHLSLGCGGGQKDAWLHEIAEDQGCKLSPVLTDTSPSLVVGSMLLMQASRGVCIDLEAWPSAKDLDLQAPVLWTAFGMVPNLDADRLLRWMSSQMGPNDEALVSANLHPRPMAEAKPDILPQYDNPLARTWYRGALRELGLEGPLVVDTLSLEPSDQAWQIQVKLNPDQSTAVIFDRTITLPPGPLQVFESRRYTPEAFERAVHDAGFEVVERAIDGAVQEGIWRLSPGSIPR